MSGPGQALRPSECQQIQFGRSRSARKGQSAVPRGVHGTCKSIRTSIGLRPSATTARLPPSLPSSLPPSLPPSCPPALPLPPLHFLRPLAPSTPSKRPGDSRSDTRAKRAKVPVLTDFLCNLCRISCNSDASLQRHLLSAQHRHNSQAPGSLPPPYRSAVPVFAQSGPSATPLQRLVTMVAFQWGRSRTRLSRRCLRSATAAHSTRSARVCKPMLPMRLTWKNSLRLSSLPLSLPPLQLAGRGTNWPVPISLRDQPRLL